MKHFYIPLILMVFAFPAQAEISSGVVSSHNGIIAKYTFDGRVAGGQKIKRICSARYPYNGQDYIPNPAYDEFGPVLQNPGGGGEQLAYYRSYYNNAASETADGRQTLELEQHHPWYLDSYCSKSGNNPLPSAGSFTWELVVRIDAFDGSDHFGMLLDNSKGAGRYPNWPGDYGDRSVITRLWMGAIKDGVFPLQFTVPVDDHGRGVTITTDIPLSKWLHIAAVYDDIAHKSRLYINGKLSAEADAISCSDRSTSFGIGWYGPDVFRVDHPIRLNKALFDAIAFTKDVRTPGTFVLSL